MYIPGSFAGGDEILDRHHLGPDLLAGFRLQLVDDGHDHRNEQQDRREDENKGPGVDVMMLCHNFLRFLQIIGEKNLRFSQNPMS
jgi:hypothetical protein